MSDSNEFYNLEELAQQRVCDYYYMARNSIDGEELLVQFNSVAFDREKYNLPDYVYSKHPNNYLFMVRINRGDLEKEEFKDKFDQTAIDYFKFLFEGKFGKGDDKHDSGIRSEQPYSVRNEIIKDIMNDKRRVLRVYLDVPNDLLVGDLKPSFNPNETGVQTMVEVCTNHPAFIFCEAISIELASEELGVAA